MLDSEAEMGRRMQGRVVTIINRSDVVGRPLAAVNTYFRCQKG
jgi:5,10-methylene-tetrahydrofolate dehydrogenase/methenyl tetrahydrofolate cyclohydrolase